MLKALYENADSNQDEVFSNDGYAYYTCFMDENYYKGKSWTVYSNCAPHTILIANQLSVSTDRKSLYAKVRYSLSSVPLLRSIISVSMVILMERRI